MNVCNWCTPGPYADLAKLNREVSLSNCPGLNFETIETESCGRWVENTCQKPDVALTAIRQVPVGEGVLLIDADAYIQGTPDWKSLMSSFFGYVLWKRPSNGAMVCLSGTLWLSNTNQCKDFLESWAARCQADPGIWDQAHLWQCVKGHVAGGGTPDIYTMPHVWSWMEGNSIEPRNTAWVVHTQASRELKDDDTHETCLETQSTIDANVEPNNARETWAILGDRGEPKEIKEEDKADEEPTKRRGRPRKT